MNINRTIASICCVLIGIGIGWCLGYTRPAPKNQELPKPFEYPQIVQRHDGDVRRKEDDMTSALAMIALNSIERGDTNQAEHMVLINISLYYKVYHEWHGGDTNVLARIEALAKKNPAVAAALSGGKYSD